MKSDNEIPQCSFCSKDSVLSLKNTIAFATLQRHSHGICHYEIAIEIAS